MLKAGRTQTLTVSRTTEHGIYLADEEQAEVLLPNRYTSLADKVGDRKEVFVYHDSEDRLVATTEQPLLRVGDRVNVMAVVSDGATSSAETVCANVKIIALDSALSGSPDAGYSLVTLDVTEDQAAAIVANPNVTLTAIPQTAEGASDAE